MPEENNVDFASLCEELLPITVEGDPIEYQINRVPAGWVRKRRSGSRTNL